MSDSSLFSFSSYRRGSQAASSSSAASSISSPERLRKESDTEFITKINEIVRKLYPPPSVKEIKLSGGTDALRRAIHKDEPENIRSGLIPKESYQEALVNLYHLRSGATDTQQKIIDGRIEQVWGEFEGYLNTPPIASSSSAVAELPSPRINRSLFENIPDLERFEPALQNILTLAFMVPTKAQLENCEFAVPLQKRASAVKMLKGLQKEPMEFADVIHALTMQSIQLELAARAKKSENRLKEAMIPVTEPFKLGFAELKEKIELKKWALSQLPTGEIKIALEAEIRKLEPDLKAQGDADLARNVILRRWITPPQPKSLVSKAEITDALTAASKGGISEKRKLMDLLVGADVKLRKEIYSKHEFQGILSDVIEADFSLLRDIHRHGIILHSVEVLDKSGNLVGWDKNTIGVVLDKLTSSKLGSTALHLNRRVEGQVKMFLTETLGEEKASQLRAFIAFNQHAKNNIIRMLSMLLTDNTNKIRTTIFDSIPPAIPSLEALREDQDLTNDLGDKVDAILKQMGILNEFPEGRAPQVVYDKLMAVKAFRLVLGKKRTEENMEKALVSMVGEIGVYSIYDALRPNLKQLTTQLDSISRIGDQLNKKKNYAVKERRYAEAVSELLPSNNQLFIARSNLVSGLMIGMRRFVDLIGKHKNYSADQINELKQRYEEQIKNATPRDRESEWDWEALEAVVQRLANLANS